MNFAFQFFLALLISWSFSIRALAVTHSTTISGADILTAKATSVSAGEKKGIVVIFLSAVCPCSNSHLQELSSLTQDYPDFSFVGVHSNPDEKKEPTVQYFEKAKLPFPVIQDQNAKIADEFKAFKTPHSFVLLANGEVAYQGGVSNSHTFDKATRKYLREALEDLKQKRSVKTPEGRTLGCVISRGEKYVW